MRVRTAKLKLPDCLRDKQANQAIAGPGWLAARQNKRLLARGEKTTERKRS